MAVRSTEKIYIWLVVEGPKGKGSPGVLVMINFGLAFQFSVNLDYLQTGNHF